VNPAQAGTKACAHYAVTVRPGQTAVVRLRLTPERPERRDLLGADFDRTFEARRHDADQFYASITPPSAGRDAALVLRQALAGMLWSKQFYWYDLARWLREHRTQPNAARGGGVRNGQWAHMVNADIVSMPDKWEYPWYAAWDLAFHTVALNLVDPDFAKAQLLLILGQDDLHPNGQMPAYEWNFGDVNPPVHAWAAWFVYSHDKGRRGEGDVRFLAAVFPPPYSPRSRESVCRC
jgi:hypothetical protein